MAAFTEAETFVVEHCCQCGMAFAMTEDFQSRRLKNRGTSFYCPAGHSQHYTGKSDVQKERERAEQIQQRLEAQRRQTAIHRRAAEHARRSAAAEKGHRTRLKNRIAKGVCPCCNRHFQNLHRHIASQHPDFTPTD